MRTTTAVFVLIALLLTVALAGSGCSKKSEDAVAAHDRGDFTEAYLIVKPLADKGDGKAQLILGVLYMNGQGVPQNDAKAAMWLQKAGDQGVPGALYHLGTLYSEGRGVRKDFVAAHMYFNLAATRYPAAEAGNREQATKDRDLVASRMTPAQIADAQRLAQEWKPKKGS